MKQLYLTLLSLCLMIGLHGQDCNINDPAPPGDDCALAPFLCGNYLDGYCSNNAGLTHDTLAGVALFQSGFIRLSPCDDSLHLRLTARDCAQGNSLAFRLMSGDCETAAWISTIVAPSGITTDFVVHGLTPDATYFLVFDGGPSESICEFSIEVAGGVGTQSPPSIVCDCTNGVIEGPDELCPADIATYTLTGGGCNITVIPGGGEPGNGVDCCPEILPDTVRLVWHIPESMNFLSDSINVSSITIQVDSSLLGIDTTFVDSIWISIEPVTAGGNTPQDSLTYCDCPGMQSCSFGIAPKYVTIDHQVEYETCVLTCYEPICFINNIPYGAPQQDTIETNCITTYIFILQDTYPPFAFMDATHDELNCYHPSTTLSVITPVASAIFSWIGLNNHSSSIIVSEPGTYYCEVTDVNNGCTSIVARTIQEDFTHPVAIAGPDFTICRGESALLSAGETGSEIQYNWSASSFNSPFRSTTVSPNVTTTYTLTVTNIFNGCSEQDEITITVVSPDTLELGEVGQITCEQPCVTYAGTEYCSVGTYVIPTGPCEVSRFSIGENLNLPIVILPLVMLCEGECYVFYGQEYCDSATPWAEDNCTTFIQQIIVSPPDTLELGEVGQITCAQPCVTFAGVEYCAAGTYIIPSGTCEVSRFSIGENFTLPTVALPIVWLCEGECHPFYSQEYCASATVSQEDNCTLFIQQIIVSPPDTLELGEVGQITCAKPCVTYAWTEYCSVGTDVISTGACEVSRLSMGDNFTLPTVALPIVWLCEGECYSFYGQEYCASATVSQEDNCTLFIQQIIVSPPDTLELGEVGQITCAQPCVTFEGVEYCAAGTYIIASGACEVSRFSIGENPTLPIDTLPLVTLCEGECYAFYGQEYCTSTTVSQEDNCTVFVQQIIVNPPTIVQAGLVGNISCNTPCLDYLGNTYCATGDYVDTTNCVHTRFTIGFVQDTVQLGIADTLTCEQPCFTFLETTYCEAGDYVATDSCTVYHFSLVANQGGLSYTGLNLNCLPNNHSYRVSFQINGVPPYKVNGTPIAGAYYLSNPITNGDAYGFVVEQVNNGCQIVVSGTYDCAFMCSGNPGVMAAARQDVCLGNVVQAVTLNQPQPAGGQVIRYLMHTSPDSTPGTIMGENTDGIFGFNAATMNLDQTYYISSAIGALSSGGALDFDNFCTRIAPGQPVAFHAPPVFDDILVENPSCFAASDGLIHVVQATGSVPLSYALDDGTFGTSPVFEGLDAGAYQLSLRDTYNCRADSLIVLTAPDSLWLDAGADREILQGESTLLEAQTNASNPVFNWTNNQDATTYTGVEWLVTPAVATEYSCTVIDGNGCTTDAAVLVKVKAGSIYYPNVLLRNSTELANQHFTLFTREGYIQQINSLQIFDRWGQLAFRRNFFPPNMPELGWDGAVRGKPVNSAVFVFVAEVVLFDGRVEVIKGDVTVL